MGLDSSGAHDGCDCDACELKRLQAIAGAASNVFSQREAGTCAEARQVGWEELEIALSVGPGFYRAITDEANTTIRQLQLENHKLEADLDDTSDTLQLHQSSGDYEAGRLLGNKAMENEIREQRAEIERLRKVLDTGYCDPTFAKALVEWSGSERLKTVEAEVERLRRQLTDTRNGLRLSIGRHTDRPWKDVANADVDLAVDFARRRVIEAGGAGGNDGRR